MSWRKHFTPVDNSGLPINVQRTAGNSGHGVAAAARFASWLPEVYAGSPNRLMRYIQYDQMDQDSEINAALDTIAEFGTQMDETTNMPFIFEYDSAPSDSENTILTTTLQQWCKINNMHKRVFRIFRNTVKYGDQVFIRDPETYELFWVDPANVEKVIVNESEGKKPETYFIKNLDANFAQQTATSASPLHGRPYAAGHGITGATPSNNSNAGSYLTGAINGVDTGTPVKSEHIIHLSLTEGMDNAWPFGVSILEPVFKVFKQKELLEDSIIIYRVHRAPERRVFFIDVGNMPPHKARQYLEQVKYEVQQKRVPNKNKDGQNVVDAAYNPMSILEDYFFAQTADGRGSKVDTLPGGENLGQIDDLRYFNNKLIRGLRVPSSYLPTGPEDGVAAYNDGKVGIAYIQEYRFSQYVERLQRQIQEELDFEFKMFLKHRGIEIDNSEFRIKFTPPMNFGTYRELQLETERATLFGQLQGIPYLSNQFKLKKYLGLTESEVKENEKYWRQENNAEKYTGAGGNADDANLRNLGIRPEPDEMVNTDAAPDLGDLDPPQDPNAPPLDTAPPPPGAEPIPAPPPGT